MSVLVPVVSTGITLNEVPDHIAFYVELGECTQHCKGCHSPHLWCALESKTDLEDLLALAQDAVDKGAKAIVLMGGTTNGLSRDDIITIINTLDWVAPVCLYSGSDDEDVNMDIAYHSNLMWIKTGSYKEELGGLQSPKTNQRFYRKEWKYCVKNCEVVSHSSFLVDCTEVFQHDAVK